MGSGLFAVSELIYHREEVVQITCAHKPRKDSMSCMPSYQCVVCGYPLNPQADGVWQQVTCWVAVGKTGNIKQVDKLFRYAHKACVESPPKGQAESLFD